jgi:hypothetical protein
MSLRRLAALSCVLALVAAPPLAGGCRSAYYDLNEQILGRHKRDLLKARVRDGREEQQRAQEQILTTLEAFQQVTGFEGGELEERYERLAGEYERSEARARAVGERIAAIERVAEDLFEEWEAEIGEITNAELRRRSAKSLRETRGRYSTLIGAMRRAEGRMAPVLAAFRDQVLFLKHNLNARAVASLEGNLDGIESDVAALVREMQAAIREAEAFVETLEGEAP